MDDNKELKIECMFQSNNYGAVACLIRIVDGGSVAKFSDVRLAKDMYKAERNIGNRNISFNERLVCLIEKHPNLTKEAISKDIINKLNAHNLAVIKKIKNDK